jgi:hypothetical protein
MNKTNIIAISGKSGSGKDLAGKLIKYLIYFDRERKLKAHFYYPLDVFLEKLSKHPQIQFPETGWEIKKFADKLKDIVCLLLGCTREQLEDQEFKATPLDEKWWYWKLERDAPMNTILFPYTGPVEPEETEGCELLKMSPRILLQLLGTECGRDILHPHIWANSLFADYKCLDDTRRCSMGNVIDYSDCEFPKWIITDCRFPNEADKVKSYGGKIIRIVRDTQSNDGVNREHPSETSLDGYKNFDYIVANNGKIEDLVFKLNEILIKENLIEK